MLSPDTALAWVLALTGGRRGTTASLGVLATSTLRLARRLARPGDPPPVPLAATLVAGGVLASGRSLARAVTRHHWPIALAAALTSRRARRGVLAVGALDAVDGWWPVRREVGLLRFAAARRLDDLAYGAGLWAGALRARDPRALLPARPPRT